LGKNYKGIIHVKKREPGGKETLSENKEFDKRRGWGNKRKEEGIPMTGVVGSLVGTIQQKSRL